MNFAPRSTGVAELALRFMARRGRGDWAALVVEPGSDAALAAQELADEMDSVADAEIERVADAADPADLAARLSGSRRPVVVSGLEAWGDSEWASLDHLRSHLARDERTALVVSQAAFESIMRAAPNFSSWLGASAWTYAPRAAELTEDERLRRLETLRDWSGLTDAEVIARAERGELPGDPEFAEWLVLLHREDLLGR